MRVLVSLFGFAGLLASCATSATVSDQRRSWREVAPRSYEFEFSLHCFCPGAGAWWRVIVEDERVTSATLVDSSTVPKGGVQPPLGGFPTIDSVFVQIERARAAKGASVEVSYDKELHYPLLVAIDRDSNAVDDEWSIQIRNFRVRRGTG